MSWLGKLLRKPPQPDLIFAAKGFYPVAIAQMNDLDIDGHDLAWKIATDLREKGCSEHQFLSVGWGGVTAIGQDMHLYKGFVDNAEATLNSMGAIPSDPRAAVERKYESAALLMVSLIMADAPKEFQRFLDYIGR